VVECDTVNQSFIIRVWVEEPATADYPARWRGHITYVSPSGARRPIYFSDLRDIEVITGLYLARLGVKLGWGWRLRAWRRRARLRREVKVNQ
jgi:hypothetical protein